MNDSTGRITTKSDAFGVVDGIKDGKPAFHANLQNNPWRKVDLGRVVPVSGIVLRKRCDGEPEVAGRLKRVNPGLSDAGKTWRTGWEYPGVYLTG